ncbi:hypothetical protein [Streptomyces sp. ME19-01-6]|uniref:hypothetical protein n=1 Tax=Streptomyces sp. ME19-01-6 TaxID=3028686 RepID=UPI0029A9218C|nr:hypothetical protein [Streptomyces sp. ME19-01-6]MDX3225274.1 hypothetical protein [Streptomyces sp. ME19-01-6]
MFLVFRYYGRESTRLRRLMVPAMLLSALGNIGINYIAPLVVAKVVADIADDSRVTVGSTLSYVLIGGAHTRARIGS